MLYCRFVNEGNSSKSCPGEGANPGIEYHPLTINQWLIRCCVNSFQLFFCFLQKLSPSRLTVAGMFISNVVIETRSELE